MYLIKANAKKMTILVFITGLPPIPSEYIFPCCASDDDDEASSKKQMETVPKNYCASDEINQKWTEERSINRQIYYVYYYYISIKTGCQKEYGHVSATDSLTWPSMSYVFSSILMASWCVKAGEASLPLSQFPNCNGPRGARTSSIAGVTCQSWHPLVFDLPACGGGRG